MHVLQVALGEPAKHKNAISENAATFRIYSIVPEDTFKDPGLIFFPDAP